MIKKVLHSTKWLNLMEMQDPENGVDSYIYTHSDWSNGQGVAIIPYRYVSPNSPIIGGEYCEYLLRQEVTPCWSMEPVLSSITGGMDKDGEEPILCAMRELEEEGGYVCTDRSRWRSLGTCHLSKSSTTVMHLFSVNLTDVAESKATGDGTKLEEKAWCEWRTDPENAVDALVGTLIFKLHNSWYER